ncbi:CHASE2 domain-containing protein [Rhodovibrionaceae bacterium A322]
MGIKGRHYGLLVGGIALALALVLRVVDFSPVIYARLAVFDLYQNLKPREYQPAPVRVVDIDNDSLAKVGQWPWPRTQIAELIERLTSMGAAVVAFDMVFSESDRTSPKQALQSWQRNEKNDDLAALLKDLPDHDEVLAETFSQQPVVAGFMLSADSTASPTPPPKKAGLAHAGSDPRRHLTQFDYSVRNLALLEDTAKGIANLSLVPDRDGVVRRVPLLAMQGDLIIPSLPAESLRVAQGASTFILRTSDASGEVDLGGAKGITSVKIGDFEVPTGSGGEFWLHYSPEVPERSFPAWQVLDPAYQQLQPWVQGQIILVGSSAPGLRDLRPTPLANGVPGVLIQAQAVEQIIFGQYLNRPDWAEGAELVFLFLVGGVMVILMPLLGAVWCALLGGAVAFSAAAVSWFAYSEANLLIDPFYPAFSALLVYLVVTTTHYLLSERERRRVRSAFTHYLSPALVERLADHADDLKLGGEMRDLTLLFCDIRSFTSISESMSAEELTGFLNAFLTPMTDVVLTNDGTIDKYMGDNIMAFWNAPLDDDNHARNGCLTALQMQARLEEKLPEWKAEAEEAGRPFSTIRIGIGVNSGECCVGNLGSQQRFDYSALGDPVNLASRLEGMTKLYGVKILVGEDTVVRAPDLAFLELDLIRVVGKQQPVRIFLLVGDETVAQSEEFQALKTAQEEALSHYRAQNWQKAKAAFAHCRTVAQGGQDVLYQMYDERVTYLEGNPPGSDWDTVFQATSK